MQLIRIVELVESGDMMGAMSIARRIYSYDLTAAKQFVETIGAQATHASAICKKQ